MGAEGPETTIESLALSGRKVAVEHAGAVDWRSASARGGLALALVAAGAPTAWWPPSSRASTPTTPMHARGLRRRRRPTLVGDAEAVPRLSRSARCWPRPRPSARRAACSRRVRYAAERRQFGRPIGSFQALRHLLADMYVRQASSWSSVLYAAAALDEAPTRPRARRRSPRRTSSRAAREVAHGAIQVFGGIAITDEHPAHRYLRRIVVREQQFGDAAHHERALGRALAAASRAAGPVR